MDTPRSPRQAPRKRAGFTIIELMLVVAVVAVLSAVAYPSFLDSIRKGRRADAVAALAQVQQAQERWRSNKSTYATNGQLTLAPSADPPGLGLGATSSKGYYAITIEQPTIGQPSASGYTVTAAAVAGSSQASDSPCQRLRVRVEGGSIFYGATAAGSDFDESASNRCWSR